MVFARLVLNDYANRVLNVIKARFDLKDKSQALNKFVEIYGDDIVEKDSKDEYVKKIIQIEERHLNKYGKRKMSLKELDKLCEVWIMFDFDLSDELKIKIRKLVKRDHKKVEIINKKIKEIITNDNNTIDRYKNLRHDLSDKKRVHIDTHFVLTFKIYKQENFILFIDFDHHDNVY